MEGYERKSVERGGKGMAAKDKQKDRRETDKGGKRQDRGERGSVVLSSHPYHLSFLPSANFPP